MYDGSPYPRGAARFADWLWGMVDEGVYLAPSQFEAGSVSGAHSEEDLQLTLGAARKVAGALA